MSAAETYAVDLDQLQNVVARMVRCEDDLDALLAELAARVRTLHDTWDGAAADAQLVAQRRWEAGFHAMHAGLSGMREAGRAAHGHYTDAVLTNTRMWDPIIGSCA